MYDNINWNFLFHFIENRGFSETWLKWLKSVTTGGTLNVKIDWQNMAQLSDVIIRHIPYLVEEGGIRIYPTIHG